MFSATQGKLVEPASHGRTGTAKYSGDVGNTTSSVQHQYSGQPAGMIFIASFMDSFLHQASFGTGYWCYDRHRLVRLVIMVGLAIDQIA